jgi:glutathione-regulated potassium-efflux system ancillary protein KefF
MIVVIHAHPYPRRSRACAALMQAIRDLPQLEVRTIYDLYPDLDVDADAERKALEGAKLVVWLHPLYWYSVPALMKLWMERVLSKGWAYGDGGTALHGKQCLWVTTTGGDELAYSPEGRHHHAFGQFVAPVEETARYCGMGWLEPFAVHGAHLLSDEDLRTRAQSLRARILEWHAKDKAAAAQVDA